LQELQPQYVNLQELFAIWFKANVRAFTGLLAPQALPPKLALQG
jgi:hypothetical protein